MKAVGVCSAYSSHNLKAADLTVSTLSDLKIYNMRRLFAAQARWDNCCVQGFTSGSLDSVACH